MSLKDDKADVDFSHWALNVLDIPFAWGSDRFNWCPEKAGEYRSKKNFKKWPFLELALAVNVNMLKKHNKNFEPDVRIPKFRIAHIKSKSSLAFLKERLPRFYQPNYEVVVLDIGIAERTCQQSVENGKRFLDSNVDPTHIKWECLSENFWLERGIIKKNQFACEIQPIYESIRNIVIQMQGGVSITADGFIKKIFNLVQLNHKADEAIDPSLSRSTFIPARDTINDYVFKSLQRDALDAFLAKSAFFIGEKLLDTKRLIRCSHCKQFALAGIRGKKSCNVKDEGRSCHRRRSAYKHYHNNKQILREYKRRDMRETRALYKKIVVQEEKIKGQNL